MIRVEVAITKMNMSLLKKERLKILRYANHVSSRPIWVKKRFCGFTLIELLVVIAILGTLAGIAMPIYSNQIEKARIVKAIAEIAIMQKEITAYDGEESDNFLPNTLDDIGRGNLLDPWGNPYEYLNFAHVVGKGPMRKDRFVVPLNSDYDLYSKGKDGKSMAPLTAKDSHDDVLRANDGRFIGLASEY
jgi:general secretion pathway protein G